MKINFVFILFQTFKKFQSNSWEFLCLITFFFSDFWFLLLFARTTSKIFQPRKSANICWTSIDAIVCQDPLCAFRLRVWYIVTKRLRTVSMFLISPMFREIFCSNGPTKVAGIFRLRAEVVRHSGHYRISSILMNPGINSTKSTALTKWNLGASCKKG